MDKVTVIVLSVILVSVILLIACLLIMKRDKEERVSVYGKTKKSLLLAFYGFFSGFPLTAWYVKRITATFRNIAPVSGNGIKKKTMKVCFLIWSASILLLVLVFMREPSAYNFFLSLFVIVVLNVEAVRFFSNREERKVLMQLEKFCEEVRHYYYDSRSVTEAITEAAETAGKEMRAHAKRILDVLTSSDVKKEVGRYNDEHYSKYLKLFLSQCVATRTYGDTVVGDTSLFVKNLSAIRNDILSEVLQKQKMQAEFTGLTFITVIPVLTLPLIKASAINTLPELTSFYKGPFGLIFPTAFLIITAVIYLMIVKMQELEAENRSTHAFLLALSFAPGIRNVLELYEKRNYGKTLKTGKFLKKSGETLTPRLFFLEKFLFLSISFVIGLVIVFSAKERQRNNLLTDVSGIETLSSSATLTDISDMEKAVIKYTDKYKRDKTVTYGQIAEEIRRDTPITSGIVTDELAKEIFKRTEEYKNVYVKWYELLIVIGISLLCSLLPSALVRYKATLMKMNMLSETTKFQSIIMMQMYIPDITVIDLLESMEQFSFIFKSSIESCINDYAFRGTKALLDMKEKEAYEPFRRLCDSFLVCEKIGILKAFDEIASDREHFTKQREFDVEQMIKKKSQTAKLIAFIPVLLVMIGYLILPYGIESVRQFSGVLKEINNN